MSSLIFTGTETEVQHLGQFIHDTELLNWDDPLAIGPVPIAETNKKLGEVRAKFLSGITNLKGGELQLKFSDRFGKLDALTDYDEVVLWFGPSAHAQLQQLQIAHELTNRRTPDVSFVVPDREIAELEQPEIEKLWKERQSVGRAELTDLVQYWHAFISSEPGLLTELQHQADPHLPYLHQSLQQIVQEYPHAENGLSRSQMIICTLLDDNGPLPIADLLYALNAVQQSIIVDKPTLSYVLRLLTDVDQPLLQCSGETLHLPEPDDDLVIELTATGELVLDGSADHAELNAIDRWIGGVHLTPESTWKRTDENLERS